MAVNDGLDYRVNETLALVQRAEEAARAKGWSDFYDTEDGRLIVANEESDVHYYGWVECGTSEKIEIPAA